MGSVFPGEEGTVLIGAHDTTYFKELENVRVSDRITLQTTYGLFEYEVNDITIVEGSEFALDSAEELLVLYTCYPYGDVANERNQKIIYTCTKVSGPLLGGGANE